LEHWQNIEGGGRLISMGKNQCVRTYQYIISLENLLEAWQEFLRGKRRRRDVQEFERDLMGNILSLHDDLMEKTYVHSSYHAFNISDPKPRNIHKASVRDRLLHHALYRKLYPHFEKTFIYDSCSCRLDKGMHKAINRFRDFAYTVSQNHTKTVWVLKGDIKKFFASIDQSILSALINRSIMDKDVQWLMEQIIGSFYVEKGKGLPLGNLTSQLLVNIYMNEVDQFIKHTVKARYYIRYADDFVVLSSDKQWLQDILPHINDFLYNILRLRLHPDKVFIKTLASGVDFLGWVHFPYHRVVRTATKRRMLKTVKKKKGDKVVIQSYLGLLQHGNAQKLSLKIGRMTSAIKYPNSSRPWRVSE